MAPAIIGSQPSPVAAAVAWSRPVVCDVLQEPAYATAAIWAEATALGLIGRGALSPLGRALVSDPDASAATKLAALTEAASALVRDATAEAIFQADLTIVVPGSPTVAVARLLDSVADRESRGAAGTWRCSAESVRRAFDSGQSPGDVLDALRAIAVGGVLPQPLEYLVADVARRHGTLRGRSVGCVLRADDPALLTEIAATKALASLRLTVLAPDRARQYAAVGADADRAPRRRIRADRRVRRRSATDRAAHSGVVPRPGHGSCRSSNGM